MHGKENRFKPATRPLNKRERRELMLDRYEDSLYAPRHQQIRRRKPKTADASPETASGSTNSKQRRLARRAEARRRATARPSSPLPAMVDVTE